jgi:uncharacterized membrane protein YeaQ/YmgE (transglycosylase-associated protein family)
MTDQLHFNFRAQSITSLNLGTRRQQMNFTTIILQLISGGVGGNIAAALLKKLNLGPVGNSIAGIVGGLITGQILRVLGSGAVAATAASAASTSGMDLTSILSNVGGAGIGGAAVMAIVGLIKTQMSKSSY